MPWASMPRASAVVFLVLANLHDSARAADGGATPVGKVIDLLTSLVTEVQDEGKREAATYEKFSCFCKTATESKSSEITTGADKIDVLSSDVEAKSGERKQKLGKMMERKGKQETLSKELDEEKARCLKEERAYDAKSADLTKALGGIKDALKSLGNSKKAGAASFLDLHGSVRESLGLAEMGQELAPSRQDVFSFLHQGSTMDPKDPEYKWHSSNIETVLKDVQGKYKAKKGEVDEEWRKTDLACKQTQETLSKDLTNNKDAITKLGEKSDGLSKDIAKAKEDLVSEQTDLQDAEGYLKDLTHRCEGRAKDWDQRTSMRSDETQALNKALEILTGTVKDADKVANKRALLLSAHKPVLAKLLLSARDAAVHRPPLSAAHRTALTSTEIASSEGASTEIATELTALEDGGREEVKHSVDLPSDDSTGDVAAWLHGGASSFVQVRAVSAEAVQLSHEKRNHEQVLAFMQEEGRRIGSSALSSLVMRAASDPFGKVKGLIQQLLERLLEESAGEATKKGFCDEQLGKTEQDRDYNLEEARKLNAEIRILEANKESLETETGELKDRIGDMNEEFSEAKKIRDAEKKDNLLTLDKAGEGLQAVNDAYDVLKEFYSRGASAAFVQASPVDEDSPGAPQGEYKGKQGSSNAILGLLQVIISDFKRTLRTTEADEKKGAADFEQMKQDTEAAIAGHTTKRQLDGEDVLTTAETIKKKSKDMKFAMDVVDANLKTLEDLKPTCMGGGGMSFKDRTAKREEEMAALKKALCKLDTDGVEADCK